MEEKLRIREEIIKLVQPKEREKVFDVGIGSGLLAIGFTKAFKWRINGDLKRNLKILDLKMLNLPL